MSDLQTVRLKPNPPGKDRTRYGGASQTQLGAEWADVKNVGRQAVNVSGVTLFHVAYTGAHDNGTWDPVIHFSSGVLSPGQTIRVHSGSGPVSALRPEDVQGADFHLFTKDDRYKWNNARGDQAALGRTASALTDRASYDANPPEGKVLQRAGNKLMPLASSAAG